MSVLNHCAILPDSKNIPPRHYSTFLVHSFYYMLGHKTFVPYDLKIVLNMDWLNWRPTESLSRILCYTTKNLDLNFFLTIFRHPLP